MQFRNTRTPAGFQPKACKTQARKTLRTLPLESIKNNNSIARDMPLQLAKPLANAPWRHSSETPERQQDSSPRHAKHKPENSPNVTFRIHKNNNSIAREMPLQQVKPLAMSLGGTGPKHSNATSTKWLSNLLGALPLARGVGGCAPKTCEKIAILGGQQKKTWYPRFDGPR